MADNSQPGEQQFVKFFVGHLTRVRINLWRVTNLLEFADAVAPPTHFSVPTSPRHDILRAATVLLHATLEDFLRYLGTLKASSFSTETLDTIPLCSLRDSPRAEKFLLGELARHRGKSVDQLLEESVQAHLGRSTFNHSSDIVRLLKMSALDPSRYAHILPRIETLMVRRHDIVHRADLGPVVINGERQPSDITAEQVQQWLDAVSDFIATAVAEDVPKYFATPQPSPDETADDIDSDATRP